MIFLGSRHQNFLRLVSLDQVLSNVLVKLLTSLIGHLTGPVQRSTAKGGPDLL